MVFYVAGDIGGTNARLQLIQIPMNCDGICESSEEVIVAEQIYPSQQYSSLTFIIQKFLKQYKVDSDDEPVVAACLAVAGPVRGNKSRITNVGWVLDGDEMAQTLGFRTVQIINDFAGIGFGLLALERTDIIPINDVAISEDAPKACLGAGTGLGEVYLTNNGTEYDVWTSEGGHVDFAPRDEIEFKLLEFFKRTERVDRVSVERIVSGLGIPRIYEFFCSLHPEEVSPVINERIRTEDPGRVIAECAQSGACSICRQTIDTFVSCYGAAAGNIALTTLPYGGLYIAGGIAPKLLWAFQQDNRFWQSFVNKGRMRSLLEKVPVFLITQKSVGLLGARVVCRRLLRAEGFHIKGQINQFGDRPINMLSEHVDAVVHTEAKSGLRKKRVDPYVSVSQSTSQLTKSAIIGGLVAAVSVVLLQTLVGRFAPSSRNVSK